MTCTSNGRRGQLAAAHYPNERTVTRSLQLDRPTCATASRIMAFSPQCSPATIHNFSGKYYQTLIATRLPTPEGWKAELA